MQKIVQIFVAFSEKLNFNVWYTYFGLRKNVSAIKKNAV